MNRLTRALWISVGLGLALYVAMTIWLGVSGIAYPYQLDYGEGIVLWFAQQIAHGQPIYKALTDFPYASSNYPPVALWLAALVMPILGDGFIGGRLLNFAALLIIAALIYRIVSDETQDRRAALIAASLFTGSTYIYHWSPLDRIDLIGVMFSIVGIYFARRQSTVASRQKWLYFSLFTCSFLLALYTKQTLFAAPAAAFLALWARDKRLAIMFALVLGLSGSAIFVAINYFTAGGFYLGVIDSNASVFLIDQLLGLMIDFAKTFPILIVLAVWSWFQRIRSKQIGVLEWYALFALAATMLAGRIGAWENYFFEAVVALCVFSGIAISRQPSAVSRSFATIGLPLLLLVQLALFWREHDPRIAANLMADSLPANQQLAQLIKQTSGTIISEDMGALAANGKPVAYYTFQYSMLARSDKWDQSWELNGLRDGIFPLVILDQGTREDVDHYRRFTREFVSALDRYYARTQTIGQYEIYTPAPALQIAPATFGDAMGLVGWRAQTETLQSGTCQVDVVWQAKRAIDRRYTAFVQLLNSNGDKVTQDDSEPHRGNYPTTRWSANEMVRETYTLNIPGDLSPGKYVLVVGWYDSETGDRLEVSQSADNTVTLKTFESK